MFYFPNSDHVIFSWEFDFCLFINYAYTYARGCMCIRRQLKETVPWGTITWSSMGKQNIQAKKVYSQTPAILQSDWFWERALFLQSFSITRAKSFTALFTSCLLFVNEQKQ